MLLGTLLPILLNTYTQLLHSVSDPRSIPVAARTVTAGESHVDLVDLDNLLIGTVGAEHPWGTQVEIPPEKWADICRRAVRREVYGTLSAEKPAPGTEEAGIMGLVNEMEVRQRSWHGCKAKHHHPDGGPCPGQDLNLPRHGHDDANCNGEGLENEKVNERDGLCLRIVNNVRKIAEAMGL
jgi:hypothetical protein